MEKIDLLRSIGFSDKFIAHIEEYSPGNTFQSIDSSEINDPFVHSNFDSKELIIGEHVNYDSTKLEII